MEQAPRKPALLIASESIAVTSGMVETVEEVVRERALAQHQDGLRQYLAIQLRSQALAERAFSDLRGRLQEGSNALLQRPGPRARLYRIARDLVGAYARVDARVDACERNDEVLVEARASARQRNYDDSAALSWLTPQGSAEQGYASRLGRLREELPADEAELLELNCARELTLEELAHVVEGSVDEVGKALDSARAHAQRMLGSTPPSRLGGLTGALQEAFTLAPQLELAKPEESTRGLPPGTVIAERYAIQQRVGEGSFGDVYRALDADVPGHVVAFKLLHKPSSSEEARKSALRELRLIASVFHPSVVDFKDHGWHEDRLWFVMPWYAGETLEKRIKREPLSREEARELFTQLAQALATMHAVGIRHQDVKPDNIFLARIGEAGKKCQRTLPVLLDLGVAAKDAEMIVAGTPLYFAPEIAAQYAGRAQKPMVTAKADVFSLALSLRNALEPSTQEHVPGTAIEGFIARRAESPPEGPVGREFSFLEPYFRRWLARNPRERPSAEQLAEELDVLTLPERARARRRAIIRLVAPIAVGSLLGLASITYVYLKERAAAHEARLRAEVTMTKLDAESARRALLEESYQTSELTRQQLSERLSVRTREAAQLDTQLAHAHREEADLVTRLEGVTSELEATRREREQTQQALSAQRARVSVLEGQLFDGEQKLAFVESELREARVRSKAAETELDELRTRARSMLGELDRARDEADAQLQRASGLEQSVASLRQEKVRLELELEVQRKQAGSGAGPEERPPEPLPVEPAPGG